MPAPGLWIGSGTDALRHVLDLRAPLQVSTVYSLEQPIGRHTGKYAVGLGTCFEDAANYVFLYSHQQLEVHDVGRSEYFDLPDPAPLAYDERMTIEIRHAGDASVTGWVRGKQAMVLPGRNRKRGSAFLWLHSAPRVRIHELRVEGTVDTVSLAGIRARWVADRRREF
ncbi:MAG: hypothetical protein AB1726_00110 [Planctomycetota bacterium]